MSKVGSDFFRSNFIGTQSERVAAGISAGAFTSGEVDFSPPEMTALASEVFA
jgi:hypothetical protein